MEITIKPEDVDQYVKDSILKSTVGATLSMEIEKSIKEMMDSYRNPIKNFMNDILKKFVIEYMEMEENKEKIMLAVAKIITPEMVETIINYGVYELKKRFESKYD